MNQKKTRAVKTTINEHQSYVSKSGNAFQKEIYSIISKGLEDNTKVIVAQPSSRISATPQIKNVN
jgi:hypothetical protein